MYPVKKLKKINKTKLNRLSWNKAIEEGGVIKCEKNIKKVLDKQTVYLSKEIHN